MAVDSHRGIAKYLSKYLSKGLEKFEGCKRYWTTLDWRVGPKPEPKRKSAWDNVWIIDKTFDRYLRSMLAAGWHVASTEGFVTVIEIGRQDTS